MNNETRATELITELRQIGIDFYGHEARAHTLIIRKLQEAYRAGDEHGIAVPHPGESMGR